MGYWLHSLFFFLIKGVLIIFTKVLESVAPVLTATVMRSPGWALCSPVAALSSISFGAHLVLHSQSPSLPGLTGRKTHSWLGTLPVVWKFKHNHLEFIWVQGVG